MKNKLLPILLALGLFSSMPAHASKIQTQGIVSQADCAARSISNASCLPQDNQIWDNTHGQPLSTSISSGAFSGTNWSVVTGTTQAIAAAHGYVANNASRVVLTLPSTCTVGDTYSVAGLGAGGWKIAQNSGQAIKYNATATGTGTGFGLQSNDQFSTVGLLCSVANTTFQVVTSQGNWTAFPLPYSASYLAVAGGGGSGGNPSFIGGGGGAGGLLSGSTTLVPGTSYAVTVGAGGAGSTTSTGIGGTGGNSVFGSIATSLGGGGGGGSSCSGPNPGGSGGGAQAVGTTCLGAAGTAGQGFAGGNSSPYTGCPGTWIGGGGGGAGAVGGTGSCDSFGSGGIGGAGVSSSITGAPVTYAGGGGGADASGGTGGGGSGVTSSCSGTNGLGGGGGAYGPGVACNGGSGVVIISVPTTSYSGVTTGSPTVTTSGGNTILTFTANGSYQG